MRSLVARVVACAFVCVLSKPASAGACSDDPEALGTARTLEIDAASGPVFGTWQYESTLALEPGEVVLTFDDGPRGRSTRRVLDALAAHCVKATFFVVGTAAKYNSETLQAIADKGHTIGGHSWSHPSDLARLPAEAAHEQIEKGFEAINARLDGTAAPFFRFPGLNDSPALRNYAAARGYAVLSTDIATDDWKGIGPETIVRRTMERLERRGSGIVLFHDIKRATAAALPAFLRALKRGGYRVVHIVPKPADEPETVAETARMPRRYGGQKMTAASTRQD